MDLEQISTFFSEHLSLTIPQFVALAATIVLAMMIGALFNQRKTRTRWEQLKNQLVAEHQASIQSFESQLEQTLVAQERLENEINQLQERYEFKIELLGKAQSQADRATELEQQLNQLQRKQVETQLALSKSHALQQTIQATSEAEKNALKDKVELLENAEQRLQLQFESLANKIFEDKSQHLKQQNASQLDGVLGPLKQQLEGFRRQVHESYTQEQSQRSALKHQLENLQNLNLKMSQDAINLTKALKGDNKQQGNWGEVILERVLQESGLRQNHEYQVQQDLKNDQGKRFKPDVIVHLPEGKDVVIDAKMTLVAYERYFNSEDDAVRQQAIKDHIVAIRAHLKGLSQKDYHKLHGIQSLDYVLMFIPVEPAFLLAIEKEPELIHEALDNNIMLVSPTNLLVALRTISNIWRYELQNQNAQKIAQQAGKLYDKLCGYLDDMEKVGRALETADKAYQLAMNKLAKGKGNVIRQAHQMQKMGIESSKSIDKQLVEQALLDDESTIALSPHTNDAPLIEPKLSSAKAINTSDKTNNSNGSQHAP